MDFLIHWPPGPVVATVQCQGLQGVRKSLIYTKKSLGPDNVPCGTPPLGYPAWL